MAFERLSLEKQYQPSNIQQSKVSPSGWKVKDLVVLLQLITFVDVEALSSDKTWYDPRFPSLLEQWNRLDSALFRSYFQNYWQPSQLFPSTLKALWIRLKSIWQNGQFCIFSSHRISRGSRCSRFVYIKSGKDCASLTGGGRERDYRNSEIAMGRHWQRLRLSMEAEVSLLNSGQMKRWFALKPFWTIQIFFLSLDERTLPSYSDFWNQRVFVVKSSFAFEDYNVISATSACSSKGRKTSRRPWYYGQDKTSQLCI